MATWFLIGILVGLCIRCICKPYKSLDDKLKDPWNWTSFGGGG